MRPLQDLVSEAICQNPSTQVRVIGLRSITRERHPLVDNDEREILLLHALEELASRQLIRLPSRRTRGAWHEGDKLPRWVTRCDEKLSQKQKSRTKSSWRDGLSLREVRARAPWEGKMLEIGPSLSLNRDSLDKALIVNNYMRQRSSNPERLPVNERALRLFGYEKALKNAHKGGLFTGRITLDNLDCYHVPEPIQGVRWPKNAIEAPILIVENSTTFYSAWKANVNNPTYSAVVFGRGKMLKGAGLSTDSLEELREESAERANVDRLPEIHYFGDIDPEGAEIPVMINKQRIESGLEPVLPAQALYCRLLDFPDQLPEHDWPKNLTRNDVAEWFGDNLKTPVLKAFDCQRRWAQEWITQAIFEEVFRGLVSERHRY